VHVLCVFDLGVLPTSSAVCREARAGEGVRKAPKKNKSKKSKKNPSARSYFTIDPEGRKGFPKGKSFTASPPLIIVDEDGSISRPGIIHHDRLRVVEAECIAI
jgi:hypothetical protein